MYKVNRVKFQNVSKIPGGFASGHGQILDDKDNVLNPNCSCSFVAPRDSDLVNLDPDKVYEVTFTEVPKYVAPQAVPVLPPPAK